jgi:L-ascorbate metabolism protein UlaG (beta-lactamase superfamily)
MHITQLRNATLVLHMGKRHVLVDPMLAPRGALPPLRFLDGKRERNPTVPLPADTGSVLAQVTHCLITHCQRGHFDHLDNWGKKWLRETQTPVICTPHDAEYLRRRGLAVQALGDDHAAGVPLWEGQVQTVRCTHGEGVVGRMMEHGVGYFLTQPGEPSVYLLGDTLLTPHVAEFVRQAQPDLCVAPAGGARFDLGGDIIMGTEDVLRLLHLTRGAVLANHLEAISHCPTRRADLLASAEAAGVAHRLWVAPDGATRAYSLEALQ